MLNTRDIGLAIRDALEERTAIHYEERGDELEESGSTEFEFVDVSDPNNLTVFMANGQAFTLRIFALPSSISEVKRVEPK